MRLCTLGGLRLEHASFQRPKALLLLCFLALEGPQERRRLAALFWPAAVRGRSDLSTTLSRLRKHAPGSVEADAVRVSTPLDCDARALLAAEAGDHAEALTLYRGRFLDGFDGRGLGAELEEWVYGTREVLAARVLLAQLGLAEEAASAGRFEEAARGAEAALRLGQGGVEPETLLRLHTLLLAGGSPEAVAPEDAEGARALLGELAGRRVPDAPPRGRREEAGLEAVAAALLDRPP